MERKNLAAELGLTTYPGRGIVIGRTPDGAKAVCAYFIMGRSENSRNRVFVTEGEGIRTEAFDPAKLEDPSLIIYAPVRVLNGNIIVTNGDQTDTIYDGLSAGKTFEESLRSREFEPDGPNYTPRISGWMKFGEADKAYSYDNPKAGEGHFIHTYMGDGNPLPSYEGEPTPVEIPDVNIDAFTELVWNAIDADNKVSLFTRFVDIASGAVETRIVNKNQ